MCIFMEHTLYCWLPSDAGARAWRWLSGTTDSEHHDGGSISTASCSPSWILTSHQGDPQVLMMSPQVLVMSPRPSSSSWRELRWESTTPGCSCYSHSHANFTTWRTIRDMVQANTLRLNWFGPSEAIWQHKSGSTLAQVMACCLMAPSHYLNQCWFLISGVLRRSAESNFTKPKLLFCIMSLKIILLTHCGLVTPYGDRYLGQHWLR